MVVSDSNLVSVAIFLSENDAPLAVGADGMEAFQIPGKRFEIFPGRIGQMLEFGGKM